MFRILLIKNLFIWYTFDSIGREASGTGLAFPSYLAAGITLSIPWRASFTGAGTIWDQCQRGKQTLPRPFYFAELKRHQNRQSCTEAPEMPPFQLLSLSKTWSPFKIAMQALQFWVRMCQVRKTMSQTQWIAPLSLEPSCGGFDEL